MPNHDKYHVDLVSKFTKRRADEKRRALALSTITSSADESENSKKKAIDPKKLMARLRKGVSNSFMKAKENAIKKKSSRVLQEDLGKVSMFGSLNVKIDTVHQGDSLSDSHDNSVNPHKPIKLEDKYLTP